MNGILEIQDESGLHTAPGAPWAVAKADTIQPSQMSSTQREAISPRKRRKRVGAAGASNDCFNCSTRSVKCDRRRPYCSNCLEDGKECSGYKTQLKWGVGVASRGKLRGLALPIAGTQGVAGQLRSARPKKRQILTTSQDIEEISSGMSSASPGQGGHAELSERPMFILQDPLPSPPSNNCQQARSNQLVISDTQYEARNSCSPTPSLHTSSTCYESTGHVSTFRHGSPTLYPQTQLINHPRIPSAALPTGPSETLSHFLQTQCRQVSTLRRISQPTSHPQTGSSFSLDGGTVSGHEPYHTYPRPDESYAPGEVYWSQVQQFYSQHMNSPAHSGSTSLEADDEDSIEGMSLGTADTEYGFDSDTFAGPANPPLGFTVLPMAPVISNGLGIGKTPRMQFLIKYYAQVISPVIVAFDGPSNPYRTLILSLAAEDETLQHALSALAASNLRQRQATGALSTGKTTPARISSMAYLTLTDEERHSTSLFNRQDQLREEDFHKNYAIKSLNFQLADPVVRKSDSVLATLLVLCLFHICDSGVAKFQIQFAGVKKLLDLRQNDLRRETNWFTRMFAMFDAMAASVNDREGQLQDQHLDISAICDDEWSLSNLAGCDEELFKSLAKLGRLNVLSQGKRVESKPPVVCRPIPHSAVINDDHGIIDGDSWARLAADEDLLHARMMESSLYEQFWREWHEIRQSLQMWHCDLAAIPYDRKASFLSELTAEQRIDLVNISESFRYAALLYTERLAHPSAASTDGNITIWVRQGLHFIRQVKSDVYLLWPLFIIGSECVNEADVDVIRTRCLDIQKDSGFLNNKSALDLLEKIWAANIPDQARYADLYRAQTGFRFTKIMELEGNEDEYIVV